MTKHSFSLKAEVEELSSGYIVNLSQDVEATPQAITHCLAYFLYELMEDQKVERAGAPLDAEEHRALGLYLAKRFTHALAAVAGAKADGTNSTVQ